MRLKILVLRSPARTGILALTLLGLILGGAPDLWEQALLTLLAAGLVLIAPPKRSLGTGPNLLFPALFLLALAAFLPAAWFPMPSWRQHLISDLNLTLPLTRTPQPWLTAQPCALFFVGLVWSYFVLSQRWDSEQRLEAARALVFGVALLAALVVAAYGSGFHVPNWNQQENRGWSPDRNQTADVLAICGVVNYVLIYDCLRHGRSKITLVWVATLVVIGAALIVSYSRAGILLFFGGIALWHLWPVRRQKQKRFALKGTALSVALLFLLLTLFFLFGGDTLERFQAGQNPGPQGRSDFRLALQQDALHLSLESPFLGVGLGNFEPLFGLARQASLNADRAIHPESDWLWAACELGWGAPVLLLAGAIWWMRKCQPFQARSGDSLRRAFLVGGILFLIHGLVDVAGHRLGSLWVGLLVISLALPNGVAVPRWRPGMLLFRCLALAMILIAGWWFASLADAPVPPTTQDLVRLEARMDQAVAHQRVDQLKDLADQALRLAPLDWHLYFQRAYAETFLPGHLAQAGNDFLVARKLEPQWVQPCFDEGVTWLAADQPDLCLDAWQETLRRATPAEVPHLFNDMVTLSASNPAVHEDLLEYAVGKPAEQLIFMYHASNEETAQIIATILAADPELKAFTPAERRDFFSDLVEPGGSSGPDRAAQSPPRLGRGGVAFPSSIGGGAEGFSAGLGFGCSTRNRSAHP